MPLSWIRQIHTDVPFSHGRWPDGRSERGKEATGKRVLRRIQIYLSDQELELNRDAWQGENSTFDDTLLTKRITSWLATLGARKAYTQRDTFLILCWNQFEPFGGGLLAFGDHNSSDRSDCDSNRSTHQRFGPGARVKVTKCSEVSADRQMSHLARVVAKQALPQRSVL